MADTSSLAVSLADRVALVTGGAAGIGGGTSRVLARAGAHVVIRVNCIAPDMADTLRTPAESMLRGRDPELVRSWIPVGRFGRPEEYGTVVLFLASELSSYVTGHTIPVDGGTIAASGWYGRYTKRGFSNLPDLAP